MCARLLSIVKIVLLPIVLGVAVNSLAGGRLEPVKQFFPLLSVAAIVFIIAIVVALNRDNLAQTGVLVALAVKYFTTNPKRERRPCSRLGVIAREGCISAVRCRAIRLQIAGSHEVREQAQKKRSLGCAFLGDWLFPLTKRWRFEKKVKTSIFGAEKRT